MSVPIETLFRFGREYAKNTQRVFRLQVRYKKR